MIAQAPSNNCCAARVRHAEFVMVGQFPSASDRQIEPKGLIGQRRKSIAHVKLFPTLGFSSVPAVQNVKHNEGDPENFRRANNSQQAVEKQVCAHSPALKPMINTDHRDKGNWDIAMRRPCPGVTRRQFRLLRERMSFRLLRWSR